MAVNEGLTVFNLVDGLLTSFMMKVVSDDEGSNDLYCGSTSDYYINNSTSF